MSVHTVIVSQCFHENISGFIGLQISAPFSPILVGFSRTIFTKFIEKGEVPYPLFALRYLPFRISFSRIHFSFAPASVPLRDPPLLGPVLLVLLVLLGATTP